MSREELEKRALEARYNLVSSKDKETIDILEELAIKALEQEPIEVEATKLQMAYNQGFEDCRKAVIDELKKWDWQELYLPIHFKENIIDVIPSVNPQEPKTEWIPVSERLPETDNENEINEFNVLLWVKNKTHPEREPQIYLGKLNYVEGDDGSGNFWGIETKPCDWAIWGWCYLNEPEVIAWQPLPQPYKAESEE